MDLDHRQGGPGLIGEDVDRQVECRLVGQQHLQPGVGVAQEGLSPDIALVADDANRRGDALAAPWRLRKR